MRKITLILAVILVVIFGYQYRAEMLSSFQEIKEVVFPAKPCSRPVTYSLGDFDERFGISRSEFISASAKAADIWSSVAGKKLFEYNADDSELTINLIYDYRQQATVELAKIGIVIKNDRTSFEALKAKYDSLYAIYIKEKASVESEVRSYNARKAAYEREVEQWNRRGGAPRPEYDALERERIALNDDAARLNKHRQVFNELVNTLNSVVSVLNRLVNELNLNVKTYNTIGASTGEEFSEGEYVRDASGTRINIYQFNDRNQLARVLLHEFGHALDMSHVDSPGAIMYRLNTETNQLPTDADTAELYRACAATLL